MNDDTNQTTYTDNPGQPAGAQNDGDTDFESLVNEFSNQTPQPQPTVQQPDIGKLLEGIKPVVQYVQDDARSKAAAAEDASVDAAVGYLKADENLAEIDDTLVKGFLQNRYTDDKSFRDAYDNRGQNAAAWDAALDSARDLMTEKVGSLPSGQMKTDIEAAEATVRGTNPTVTDAADEKALVRSYVNMTDQEWAEEKANSE